MKTLKNTINKIESILDSLENILQQEYNNLLNTEISNRDMLELIEKKNILFKKFIILSKDRLSLEKKIGIVTPYKNNYELNNCWNKIIKKCFFLRKLNRKNKILINKRFHLNQYFLELLPKYKRAITYNLNGDLKMLN